jgi:hypothetical protein
MTDISITAANVVAGATAKKAFGLAGATITAGQWVYLDSVNTGKWQLADSNGAAALRRPDGVALNSASVNQPISVATAGPVTIGGTLTAGVAYYMSDTPGGMCPVADVGTGEYACILGIATSATVIDIGIHYSGVAL